MNYKKTAILLLSLNLPFYAVSALQEEEIENSDKDKHSQIHSTSQTLDEQQPSQQYHDILTVIAASSKSDLTQINSNIAGKSVISSGLIAQKQADNVAELLNTLPGVSSAGSVRPGGQSINIWGFSDVEDVKIIVDGAQKGFEKYQQGSIFIEPELLKQIEVNKGPFDVRNGNGGFGGVIRMETKNASDLLEPDELVGALIKYSFHSNNHLNMYTGSAFGRTDDDMFDGLVYFTQRDSGDFKRADGSRFMFSEDAMDSYMGKLTFRPNENHTFSLSAIRSERDAWQPWAAKYVEKMTPPTQAQINQYGYRGAWLRKLVYREQTDDSMEAKWNYLPTSNPLINLTLKATYSKTKQHDSRPSEYNAFAALGTMGNESWVSYTDKIFELENISQFNTGSIDHELMFGAQLHLHDRDTLMYYKSYASKPEYNHGYFQPAYMPSGKQTTYSFYVQDQISIGDLVLTPSLRYDHVTNKGKGNLADAYNDPDPTFGHDYSSVSYAGWSPRFGVYWQATENVGFFGDISHSWRAPTIDESYEVQYTPNFNSVASGKITATSLGLEREKITSIRAGNILDFENLLSQNDKLQIRSTLFRQQVSNEIFVTRQYNGSICGPGVTCPLGQSNYRNVSGKLTVTGFELESYYDSKYWFANASLAIQKGERDTAPQAPWMRSKTYVATIPPRKASLTLGFNIPDWEVSAGWNGQFVRKQDRTGSEDRNNDGLSDLGYYALGPSKGYALHNLFVNWKPQFLKRSEVKFYIENLFNREYEIYLGENTYGMGRNVKVSFSYQF